MLILISNIEHDFHWVWIYTPLPTNVSVERHGQPSSSQILNWNCSSSLPKSITDIFSKNRKCWCGHTFQVTCPEHLSPSTLLKLVKIIYTDCAKSPLSRRRPTTARSSSWRPKPQEEKKWQSKLKSRRRKKTSTLMLQH